MTLRLDTGSLLACSVGARGAWGVVGAVGGWPTGRRCPVASVPCWNALRSSGMDSTRCDGRYRAFLECDGLSSPTPISKVSRRGNLLSVPLPHHNPCIPLFTIICPTTGRQHTRSIYDAILTRHTIQHSCSRDIDIFTRSIIRHPTPWFPRRANAPRPQQHSIPRGTKPTPHPSTPMRYQFPRYRADGSASRK
jgi:hypothetical protein